MSDAMDKALSDKKPKVMITSFADTAKIKEAYKVTKLALKTCYYCFNPNNEGSRIVKTKDTAVGVHVDCHKSYNKAITVAGTVERSGHKVEAMESKRSNV